MIAIEELLRPISDTAPSGEYLEYDAEYLELEQAAQGTPEQEMGDSRIAAVEPDWRDLSVKASAVLARTHDLRAAQRLLGASIRLDGMAGLRDGLTLIRGFVHEYWDSVHPQLDPDDGDPTMRVNTMLDLCDKAIVLDGIRGAALVEVRGIGRFSLRDVLVAEGMLRPPAANDPEGQETPELASINAAFMEVDLETLVQTHELLTESRRLLEDIDTRVREHVGTENSPDLAPLASAIEAATQVVAAPLGRRGGNLAEEGGASSEEGHSDVQDAGAQASRAVPGVISSRADAVQAINRVCDYYRRTEPSSPVPLLLERAKRLMDKNFLELIRDLAPDGLSQVEVIRGPDAEDRES